MMKYYANRNAWRKPHLRVRPKNRYAGMRKTFEEYGLPLNTVMCGKLTAQGQYYLTFRTNRNGE